MSKPRSPKQIARSIQKDYDHHRKLIEASMKGLNPGSAAYLNRVVALAKLAQSYRQELVDRGVMPSNLGVHSVPNFVFKATTSRQEDTRDDARKELDARYDAEFGYSARGEEEEPETPAAPAPKKPRRRTK